MKDQQFIKNTLNLIDYSIELIESQSKIKIWYKENTIWNYDFYIKNGKKIYSRENYPFDKFCDILGDFIEFYYLLKR